MEDRLVSASKMTAILIGLLLLNACGVMSSVDFTQPAAKVSSAPVQAIGVTAGGVSRVTTAGGFVTGSSFGAQTNKVSGQTASGYTVQLNIQGQLAQ